MLSFALPHARNRMEKIRDIITEEAGIARKHQSSRHKMGYQLALSSSNQLGRGSK